MKGMMTAPASLAQSMLRRWMRLRGLSRGTRIRGRRSLRVTSAARCSRLVPAPVAMLARLLMEQGQTTMPSCCQEPLAGAAPRQAASWLTSARACRADGARPHSASSTAWAPGERMRWLSTSGRAARWRSRHRARGMPLAPLTPTMIRFIKAPWPYPPRRRASAAGSGRGALWQDGMKAGAGTEN